MLFSRDDVSASVNKNFEPVWVRLRPVPILRIDFGEGRVLTRTLHGNILTSVCTAEGRLLDALPGIYTPAVYLDRLEQLRRLAIDLGRQPVAQRAAWVKAYHVQAVKAIQAKDRLRAFELDVGKGKVERPTKTLLAGPREMWFDGKVTPNGTPGAALGAPAAAPAGAGPPPAAGWKELAEDTALNESARRRQIHALLAREGLVPPGKVLRPIYRDVLHADLDDPYLGLGKTLFAHYPFVEEDRAR